MPKKRWFFPLLLLLLGVSGWFIFVQGQKLETPKTQTSIELHQVHPENPPVLEQPVNQNFLNVFLTNGADNGGTENCDSENLSTYCCGIMLLSILNI